MGRLKEAAAAGVKLVMLTYISSFIVSDSGKVKNMKFAKERRWLSIRYYHPAPLVPVMYQLLVSFPINAEWVMTLFPWTGGRIATKGNTVFISTAAGVPFGKRGAKLLGKVLRKRKGPYIRVYRVESDGIQKLVFNAIRG